MFPNLAAVHRFTGLAEPRTVRHWVFLRVLYRGRAETATSALGGAATAEVALFGPEGAVEFRYSGLGGG